MDKLKLKRLNDSYHRTLNYLRISLTDRCNLRCIYCLVGERFPKLEHKDILTYEEILRLARIAVGLGVRKIRLTGGEPLVRKGVDDFISQVTAIEGLQEVSLTTNGVRLKDHLISIKRGGIRRINISLDSLRPKRYEGITGFDRLASVLEAIEEARRMGFHPLKINMVVMRGINDDEILDFARVTMQQPYHVRFIEYMPIGIPGSAVPFRHVPTSEIKERLSRLGALVPLSRQELDGPAEYYRLEGARGQIGFISAMSHHFCRSCNRLRLTASGHLRPCLLSDLQFNAKEAIRNGASDRELADLFLKATSKKPQEHQLTSRNGASLVGRMHLIGG